MALRHNFTYLKTDPNPITGFTKEITHATTGWVWYAVLFLVYVVFVYVFMQKTQDISKSMIQSLHIVVLVSICIYFAGILVNMVFISEVFLLALIVGEAMALAGIHYARKQQ